MSGRFLASIRVYMSSNEKEEKFMNDRPYRMLFSLLVLFFSVLSIGLALGWTTPLDYLESFLIGVNERWVLGILGLLGALLSITIFRNSLKNTTPTQTNVTVTSLGHVRITINALENMATKVTKQVGGVKETKTIIKCTPNGIAVFIQVNLVPDINIPEKTKEIQLKIKEYFANVTGIQVEEVRILVTKLSNDAKGRVE